MFLNVCIKFLRMSAEVRCADGSERAIVRLRRFLLT